MDEFIASIQLPEEGDSLPQDVPKLEGVTTGVADTVVNYVDGGMLITFPAATPLLARQDVLYSLLVAQLAADKQFNCNTQLKDWVDVFHSTLDGIQYTNSGFSNTTPIVKTDKFLLSDFVVQELTKDTAMARDVNTFKAIFSTLQSLPPTNTAVKIFLGKIYDSSSHNTTSLFCSCGLDGSGNAVVNLLMLSLQGVKEVASRPLSHTYNTKDVSTIVEETSGLLLNRQNYAHIRDVLIRKLGDRVHTLISQLEK